MLAFAILLNDSLKANHIMSTSPLRLSATQASTGPLLPVPAALQAGRTAGSSLAVIDRLSEQLEQIERSSRKPSIAAQPAYSTGCAAMDDCLPRSGYAAGSVVEYLRTTSGCGATYLALTAASAALQASQHQYLVIIDTHHQFYPPMLASHRLDLQRVIWVRPQSPADCIWATDQALRNPAVAAVVADLEVLTDRDARRLQLAAESGGGVGLLVRGLQARRMPSWADVQWVVRSSPTNRRDAERPKHHGSSIDSSRSNLVSQNLGSRAIPLRQLEVLLARLRGGKAGTLLKLCIQTDGRLIKSVQPERHEHARPCPTQNTMHLAAQLARAANSSRTAATG
jgi:hypothetical protein